MVVQHREVRTLEFPIEAELIQLSTSGHWTLRAVHNSVASLTGTRRRSGRLLQGISLPMLMPEMK
jgi:ABC-type transport system involved in cytochrome c biogenesis permease component